MHRNVASGTAVLRHLTECQPKTFGITTSWETPGAMSIRKWHFISLVSVFSFFQGKLVQVTFLLHDTDIYL